MSSKDKNATEVKSGFRPGMRAPRSKPRLYINIGALLDIPTSSLVVGKKGETILNGGLGPVVGITGGGNTFKSVLSHYMMLSACDKFYRSGLEPAMLTYDTESNVVLQRLDSLASKFDFIPKDPISDGQTWIYSNKKDYQGEDWYMDTVNDIQTKAKDNKSLIKIDCFKDPYNEGPYEIHIPTFYEIDSYTELTPSSLDKKLQGDLDDTSTIDYGLKQGQFKSKVLMQLPSLSGLSNNYFILTAHTDKKKNLEGPYAPKGPESLPHMKNSIEFKSVGSKFQFLTTVAWTVEKAEKLENKNTKTDEFPKTPDSTTSGDLLLLRLTPVRNKSGFSGISIPLVLSQSEGVLPSLTEFYYIKEKNFGIGGNDRTYFLDLLPDVSLSRTTVRQKLDTNPLLRRAVNITAELLQLKIFHPALTQQGLICTPNELYEDIKKLGYDWNVLLNTRGYWLPDQYGDPVPFLSTVDLLKMRLSLYKPYFLEEKKK